MIDLHMHSIHSDGALIPAELARRTEAIGCTHIAITDHVDISNVDVVVSSLVRFCNESTHRVKVIPGVEVTHVAPDRIADVINAARTAGARIVLVHGETIVEPVAPGTNEAAIEAGADILAHPGLITRELASRAAGAGVALELSGRGGHSFTNGHVAKMAMDAGATLVFSTDAHQPRDLMDRRTAIDVITGAGLARERAESILDNARKIAEACSVAV